MAHRYEMYVGREKMSKEKLFARFLVWGLENPEKVIAIGFSLILCGVILDISKSMLQGR